MEEHGSCLLNLFCRVVAARVSEVLFALTRPQITGLRIFVETIATGIAEGPVHHHRNASAARGLAALAGRADNRYPDSHFCPFVISPALGSAGLHGLW